MSKTRTVGQYTVGRGAYYGTTDDRADRWYVWPTAGVMIDRRGSGHATMRDAVAYARECNLCDQIDAAADRRWEANKARALAAGYDDDDAAAYATEVLLNNGRATSWPGL